MFIPPSQPPHRITAHAGLQPFFRRASHTYLVLRPIALPAAFMSAAPGEVMFQEVGWIITARRTVNAFSLAFHHADLGKGFHVNVGAAGSAVEAGFFANPRNIDAVRLSFVDELRRAPKHVALFAELAAQFSTPLPIVGA